MSFYNQFPKIVDRSSDDPNRVTQSIKLEYLGRCKSVDNKPAAASAWVNGGWSVSILETALRGFFEGPRPTNDSAPTYYSMLGITQEASPDDIKKAYRRVAKQWHPDVNQGDPDAENMFKQINEANAVLSDVRKRKKYDFALKIVAEATSEAQYSNWMKDQIDRYNSLYGYRSPLKCGNLEVEGTLVFGRLTVDKILKWDDIIDNQGRTMTVSWAMGDKSFTTHWI
jgi:DnaJ-domain-containing protein 1